jgi:hypothetical protein
MIGSLFVHAAAKYFADAYADAAGRDEIDPISFTLFDHPADVRIDFMLRTVMMHRG